MYLNYLNYHFSACLLAEKLEQSDMREDVSHAVALLEFLRIEHSHSWEIYHSNHCVIEPLNSSPNTQRCIQRRISIILFPHCSRFELARARGDSRAQITTRSRATKDWKGRWQSNKNERSCNKCHNLERWRRTLHRSDNRAIVKLRRFPPAGAQQFSVIAAAKKCDDEKLFAARCALAMQSHSNAFSRRRIPAALLSYADFNAIAAKVVARLLLRWLLGKWKRWRKKTVADWDKCIYNAPAASAFFSKCTREIARRWKSEPKTIWEHLTCCENGT